MSQPAGHLEEALFLDLLRLGHRARLRAFGTSMVPWVWPGQVLTLEPPPFVAPALAPGDLVLARSGGCLRLHRLIGPHRGGGWWIKGDAAWLADPMVSPEHLYGRVVSIEGGSWATRPLSGPQRVLGRTIAGISWAQWRMTKRCLRWLSAQ